MLCLFLVEKSAIIIGLSKYRERGGGKVGVTLLLKSHLCLPIFSLGSKQVCVVAAAILA